MPRLLHRLPAASLLLATLALSHQAQADASGPQGLVGGLLGAWGDDSSCLADVAVFRADGTVTPAGATPDAPVTTYAVSGTTITFTQGQKTAEFAFGLNGQATAWSNGSIMVLKERCADQTPFAAGTKTGGATPAPAAAVPTAPLPLFDQVKAMAAQPVTYKGVPIKILSVDAHPEADQDKAAPAHGTIIAIPDPQAAGPDATLLYHVFPTEAAAVDYVSLSQDQHGSFVYAGRGPGFFSTISAKDEGPSGQAAPVTIDCLRFHPKGQQSVTVSCFAHMPGTPLVAGGAQSFPLAQKADKRDMGPKEDLTEVLDLTSIAISQLRSLTATAATP
jgi:hypothetical protein